jgi:hypothetical protein
MTVTAPHWPARIPSLAARRRSRWQASWSEVRLVLTIGPDAARGSAVALASRHGHGCPAPGAPTSVGLRSRRRCIERCRNTSTRSWPRPADGLTAGAAGRHVDAEKGRVEGRGQLAITHGPMMPELFHSLTDTTGSVSEAVALVGESQSTRSVPALRTPRPRASRRHPAVEMRVANGALEGMNNKVKVVTLGRRAHFRIIAPEPRV